MHACICGECLSVRMHRDVDKYEVMRCLCVCMCLHNLDQGNLSLCFGYGHSLLVSLVS